MEGDMAIRKTSPYAPRTGGNSSSFEEWILGCPKYAKYGIWGAYLGAPNMVKWKVPGKILQNAVQTR